MTLLFTAGRLAKAVPFARDLALHGDRTALVGIEGELSYRELAARVATVAARLGTRRRLVMLAGANRIDSVVAYLAALSAGHPVLLVPGGSAEGMESLLAAYDPDVVVSGAGDQLRLVERRADTAHELHPDLALLLSTSGSTGSPKLVRLSHDNLQANAESIAEYLNIRDTDRAVTTLPMHYCYGLSVLNSHLLRGATLVLTELSVADTCFWELFASQRCTTFAAVPYTFDLLDRVGFAEMSLPSLRYLTQAGGRLAPERVRRYAELGQRNGWDLFVMYGQTEATARMAYLPPDLARSSPHAIGLPIPGGSFRLEPMEDGEPGTGELVYTGRNVMLGYAETPADLALGRTVNELRTGDIGRLGDNGLYEVVGRLSRFVKVFGLRIDLQRVESLLHDHGLTACAAGTDDELVIAVEHVAVERPGGACEPVAAASGSAPPEADPVDVQRLVAGRYGLPSRTVSVHFVAQLPRLASGKPDYPAVRALAASASPPEPTTATTDVPVDLCALFAEVLERTDVTEDSSFVSLGGDSLSYVEMSIRLEQALGHLPAGWHTAAIRDLHPVAAPERVEAERPPRRRIKLARLDTTVALRAIAIVLIVGSHIQVFDLPGGAHVLIGVAGFNFARFQLTSAPRLERIRNLGRSVSRIMLACMTWIAAMYLLTDDYSLASVFLANFLVGPDDPNLYGWHFWFVEALVYFLLILLALLSLPVFDRLERRYPFALPLALAALGLISRYQLVPGMKLATPAVVFWLFALGWATAKATTFWQRLLVAVAVLATVPGLFGNPGREVAIVIGLMLLVWAADVPSTRLLNRIAGVLAASSVYIYLTHWQIFRPIDDTSRPLALVASLAFGVLYALVVTKVLAPLPGRLRARVPLLRRRTAAVSG